MHSHKLSVFHVILLESDVLRHTEIGNNTLVISWLWLLEGDWTGKKTARWTSQESQVKFNFRSRPQRQLFLGRQQQMPGSPAPLLPHIGWVFSQWGAWGSSITFLRSFLHPATTYSLLKRSLITGKFWERIFSLWKRWEYQTTWPASWEICMQVRKQQLELGTEKQTGSKPGKKYVKAVYCHPAYLTYMQNTSWETLGWMKHKLESRLPG